MRDPGLELLQACERAQKEGADFPSVWNTVLKKNRLVRGQPRQAMRGSEPALEIDLTTGQRLIFAARAFSIA
jgi:hypothetical protein